MKSNSTEYRTQFIVLGLILLSTVVVYGKTIGFGFYFDDGQIINNSFLRSIFDLPHGVKRNRPLIFILWFAISSIWGLNPAPFHAVAVFLHLLCGLSLYFMLRTIIKNARVDFGELNAFAPLITTGFFLLHPLQTESVVYSFQAMSVLPMATSCFWAVTYYVKYRSSGNKFYLFAVFLFTFLASTSRESAIALPVCLWLVEFLFLSEGNFKKSLKRLPIFLGCLAVSAAIIAIGASFVSYSDGGMGFAYKKITPFSYMITQFVVIIKYIRLIFFPVAQNLDYDLPVYSSLFSLKPFLSLLILLGLLISGFYLKKKNPMFAFGVFWFFLYLAPTSTILPIEDIMFEHRLYLPIAGAGISIIFILNGFLSKNKPIPGNLKPENLINVISIMILFSLGFIAFFRLEVWKDRVALWSDVVKKSPNKSRPHNNLGMALADQSQYNEAIFHYRKAVQIEPNSAEAHNNLGIALANQGDLKEAMVHYSRALQIKPDYAVVYNNIGINLGKMEHIDKAITYFLKALKKKPAFSEAHNNLGIALIKKGKISEAISHFYEALRIKPNFKSAQNNLEFALNHQGSNKN